MTVMRISEKYCPWIDKDQKKLMQTRNKLNKAAAKRKSQFLVDSYGQVRNKVNARGEGGVHNMLRVRVCASHMDRTLGPKFSKQGSLFRQIFHKQGWVIQKLVKNSKKWVVFHQKSS